MTVYFSVMARSEAGQLLADHYRTTKPSEKKLRALSEQFNAQKYQHVVAPNGRVLGFYCAKRPRNWGTVPNHPGAYYPRTNKENKELLRKIRALRISTASSVAYALFGGEVVYVEGLCVYVGVECNEIAGRYVLSFVDDSHVKRYKKSEHLTWPKGLRPVAASTVDKWEQQPTND